MSKKDNTKDKKVAGNNNQQSNASNAFLKQMKQNIQQKMKTDQRKDVDLEEIKQQELKQQQEEKVKGTDKKGVKIAKPINKQVKQEASDWREILKRMTLGGVSAACSVVPGSSSTVLTAKTPHMHNKMCESFVSLFKPRSSMDWLWNFLWMLPFIIVFLGVFILSYYVYFKIQEAGYGIAMVFLFIGISIFSFPLLWLMTHTRPRFAITRQQFDDEKDQNKKPGIVWTLFVIGFVLILGIAFVARFAWTPDSFPISTPTLANHFTKEFVIDFDSYNNLYNSSIQTSFAFQVLFASFLCGICMLIPGLSGSYMLGVLGSNGDINVAIQYAFNHYAAKGLTVSDNWAWATTIISFIGAFCGIVAALFFIKYMRSSFNNGYNALVMGMYIASMIAIFIAISKDNYTILSKNHKVLGCALGLMFASAIPCFGWILVCQRFGFIDTKALKFIGRTNLPQRKAQQPKA